MCCFLFGFTSDSQILLFLKKRFYSFGVGTICSTTFNSTICLMNAFLVLEILISLTVKLVCKEE